MRATQFALLCLLLSSLIACESPSFVPERLPTRAAAPSPAPRPIPTPSPISARTYYNEGLARGEAGDAQGAQQSFTWAIQQAVGFAPAYVARGAAYLAQGQLDLALADADAALEADASCAAAHALRAETLRLLGRAQLALEAFDDAVGLDPTLRAETFRCRWLAARRISDAGRLLALSREYTDAQPNDALRHYYRGWALTQLGTPGVAVSDLAGGIEATADPPAVLWFVLGHAYGAEGSWQEAVTSLETARALVQAGDTSLVVHSDQPVADLFGALGRAYLRAGRCADAETMLEYALAVGASASRCAAALEDARVCQTPTPTAKP